MSVLSNLKAICQLAYDVTLFVQFNIAPPTDFRSGASRPHAPTLSAIKPALSGEG